MYIRRTKLSPDIEGNGLELWRKLSSEYDGNDELVKMAGRARFLDYPQCKNFRHLNHTIDDWLDMLYKYGDEMGSPAIHTLFLRMLPDALRIEITRRPEMKNWIS